jgi:hypothetical protein
MSPPIKLLKIWASKQQQTLKYMQRYNKDENVKRKAIALGFAFGGCLTVRNYGCANTSITLFLLGCA